MTSTTTLNAAELVALVETYFAAVDQKDMAATLACFTPDARFAIANHGVLHEGRDIAIRGMYERLHARYAQVWHGDFSHTVDVASQRIASRFRVENITHQGEKLVKNNCNFFELQDGRFNAVYVYMSGENSLN
jgi:ketosteroid isomerase-like protein